MKNNYKISIWIFVQPFLFVVLLWVIFGLDQLFQLNLYRFSLEPGNYKAWWGIFTFPLLHGGLDHIAGNSISIFVLLSGVRFFFPKLFTRVFIVSYLLPGIITWVIGRPSFHLGASGMIYALAAFLFISGLIRMNRYLLALSMLVVFVYGNMFWYMFPIEEGISWEGHLSGAITGLVLAIWFWNKNPTDLIKEKEYFIDENEEDPLIGDLWKGEEPKVENTTENITRIVYHIKPNQDKAS